MIKWIKRLFGIERYKEDVSDLMKEIREASVEEKIISEKDDFLGDLNVLLEKYDKKMWWATYDPENPLILIGDEGQIEDWLGEKGISEDEDGDYVFELKRWLDVT